MKLPDSQIENLHKRDHRKAKKGICAIPRCGNNRPKFDCVCPKHRKRIDKVTDPVRYTYNYFKSNAKRRKKDFTITLEYFRQFCKESGYMEGKGRTPDALTIDRVKNHLGYIPGNLQILSHSKNSAKGAGDDCPF